MKFAYKKKEKGVSEVIGTILILGITVTLFSSIFYYVAVIPPPKAQIYASFSSTYYIEKNGTAFINITNMGGDTVPISDTNIIFIFSNSTGTKTEEFALAQLCNWNKNYWPVGYTLIFNANKTGSVIIKNILTSVKVMIYNTNQLIWQNTMGYTSGGMQIIGVNYSPYPISAKTIVNVTFNAYVIYNLPSNIHPKIILNLTDANKLNQNNIYIYKIKNNALKNVTSWKNNSIVMNYSYPFNYYANVMLEDNYTGNFTVKAIANLTGLPNVTYNFTLSFINYNYTFNKVFQYALSVVSITPIGKNSKIYEVKILIYNPYQWTEVYNLTVIGTYSTTSKGVGSTKTSYPVYFPNVYTFPKSFTTEWANITYISSANNIYITASIISPNPLVPVENGVLNETL